MIIRLPVGEDILTTGTLTSHSLCATRSHRTRAERTVRFAKGIQVNTTTYRPLLQQPQAAPSQGPHPGRVTLSHTRFENRHDM
jgi:hypothetical protein